jgi:hypothetical protein
MHLKVIQQMVQILCLRGIPLLLDSAFEQVLVVGASNNSLMAAGGSDEMDRTYITFVMDIGYMSHILLIHSFLQEPLI